MHSATRSIVSPLLFPRSHGGFHAQHRRVSIARGITSSSSASRPGFGEEQLRSTRLVASVGMERSSGRDARELRDEAEFASVASGDGEVSICGFGSLLSERSALYTFPNLRNFRVAVLRDFRRVFAHVAPVFLDRGIANIETKELSSLSVEPCVGESIVVTVFEIPVAEVPAFIEREHEFRFLSVTVEDSDEHPFSQRAYALDIVMKNTAAYDVTEAAKSITNATGSMTFSRYGEMIFSRVVSTFAIVNGLISWRLLWGYACGCSVLAARSLGLDAYDNFLDHTYLGDRTTTIRKYFEAGLGVGIMDEKPPVALRERYGG